MKTSRCLPVLLCLALLAGLGNEAWAHAPRARVGIVFGPVWGPMWAPAPWHYPPPVIVAPPPPPVYIERSVAPAEPAARYWYYCASAGDYYPAVPSCPEPWLRVLPETEP